MVAIMNEALELMPGQKVLEIGAGSGYHAATIAETIGPDDRVYTVERVESLVRFARENLKRAGYSERVIIIHGDGSLGYPERAPYDRIVVTAATPPRDSFVIFSPFCVRRISSWPNTRFPIGTAMTPSVFNCSKSFGGTRGAAAVTTILS